jgi:hypothetical protein
VYFFHVCVADVGSGKEYIKLDAGVAVFTRLGTIDAKALAAVKSGAWPPVLWQAIHLLLVENMGATCVEKLTGPVTGVTSTGIMKSYLQPLISKENRIETRNIERFFMVSIFNFNTKKDFDL